MNWSIVFSVIIGYLLGSINTSLVVGKFYGIDVRKHGSGNAGTTNTLRTLGKKAAIFVLVGDALKGVLACLIGRYLTGDINGVVGAGAAAVVGHNWPIFFGFKGGKGVLTSAAVILMIDWQAGLIALLIFILIVALTRYVSLGSMVAAIIFPIMSVILKRPQLVTVFGIFLALLIVIRHRANLGRLLQGKESKLGKKKT